MYVKKHNYPDKGSFTTFLNRVCLGNVSTLRCFVVDSYVIQLAFLLPITAIKLNNGETEQFWASFCGKSNRKTFPEEGPVKTFESWQRTPM